jgi:hypothetical protein
MNGYFIHPSPWRYSMFTIRGVCLNSGMDVELGCSVEAKRAKEIAVAEAAKRPHMFVWVEDTHTISQQAKAFRKDIFLFS